MRIFVHNFVADKAKIRRHAAAWQGFLTQYAAKFAEKTCAYAYEDRFLIPIKILLRLMLTGSAHKCRYNISYIHSVYQHIIALLCYRH